MVEESEEEGSDDDDDAFTQSKRRRRRTHSRGGSQELLPRAPTAASGAAPQTAAPVPANQVTQAMPGLSARSQPSAAATPACAPLTEKPRRKRLCLSASRPAGPAAGSK